MLIANILSAVSEREKKLKCDSVPFLYYVSITFQKGEKRERERDRGKRALAGSSNLPNVTHTLSHNVKLAARQTETKGNKKNF